MQSVCDSDDRAGATSSTELVVVPSNGHAEGYVLSSSSQSVSFSMPSMLSPPGTFKVYGDTGMICLFSQGIFNSEGAVADPLSRRAISNLAPTFLPLFLYSVPFGNGAVELGSVLLHL